MVALLARVRLQPRLSPKDRLEASGAVRSRVPRWSCDDGALAFRDADCGNWIWCEPVALNISPNWTPTPANINALPDPLRRYIHDLKTICDPAGDVAEMFRLRWRTSCCGGKCERLAAKAGEDPTASSASPSVASDRPGHLRPSSPPVSPCDDGRQRASEPRRPVTS